MTHFICSRDGLFVFDENSAHVQKILDGHYFGIARKGNRVYLFGFLEGTTHDASLTGCIWSFYFVKGKIFNFKKELGGLDTGCHQMTIFEDHMYIPETYQQRLIKVRIDEDGDLVPDSLEYIYLWPKAKIYHRTIDPSENVGYLHVNAVTVQDDRFFFMCPRLGVPDSKLKSTIQVWNPRDWTMIDEYDLDRWFCHDLVVVGHEIYFCDGLNSICKLNTVTRQVVNIHTTKGTTLDGRHICRGLSINSDMEFLASTPGTPSGCVLFTKDTNFEIESIRISATMITRIDGLDYNNQDSKLRRSWVKTVPASSAGPFFAKMVSPSDALRSIVGGVVFTEEGLNHRRNPSLSNIYVPKSIDEFLNPMFENMPHLTPYIQHKEKCVIFENPDCKDLILPEEFMGSNVFEISGHFYNYPLGHGMGWHTNISQVESIPSMGFRCYFVRTTGGTFFFYRHPFSNKIHAVHDVDYSVNVFHLTPGPGFFWHAVGSVAGDRFSIGYRTGILGVQEVGVDPKFYL